jgi:diguanylate cyclase (GGDEF)-like protein
VQAIKISDLMTKDVRSFDRRTPLRIVAEAMATHRISCTLVTDGGAPVGIVTERDMVKFLLETTVDPALLNQAIEERMSSPIVTLRQDESLYGALVVARAEKLRHLPVVDADGGLVGLVTQSDLTRAHFHVIETQAETIERAIKERTTDLETANAELQALSMEDTLMGFGNRRAMEVDLDHTHATAVRHNRQYCVALADVDYFKEYNDRYGHGAGDEALRNVGRTFQACKRKSDRIYRYGGEEVLFLLSDTDAGGALQFMRRAIEALAHRQIPHRGSPLGVLTSSAGVSGAITAGVCAPTWKQVVGAADRALYQSKQATRNTVSLAA